MLLKSQLHWAGHIYWMENHHLPKILLYSKLSTGYCGTKDCLKKILWCLSHQLLLIVNHDVSFFENNYRAALRDKRQRRKYCNAMPSSPVRTFSYNCCDCLMHVTYWTYQSQMCLQLTWTGSIFFCFKPWWSFLPVGTYFKYVDCFFNFFIM